MTGLLSLIQWLSPAFPTGAFAYSHGLEQFIADGAVHDAASVQNWLWGVLEYGGGWQDAVLLGLSLQPGADHAALGAVARALAPSAERLAETLDQGAAFQRTHAAITQISLLVAPLPVVVGQAAGPLQLPAPQVIALYLHAFASNLVTIATRAVPLGQTAGQSLLSRAHPLIEALSLRAANARPDDLANAALASDLAAMRHETLDVRLFKT